VPVPYYPSFAAGRNPIFPAASRSPPATPVGALLDWTPLAPLLYSAYKSPKQPLRSWRVSILRKRVQYIKAVKESDACTAEVIAVAQFKLDHEQHERIAVREEE
jgi:hypothetical protein